MKAVLDACVLYPTVLREVLLGVAGRGLFVPLWSPRILEEWVRAAARLGPLAEAGARAEVAAARAAFPGAEVHPDAGLLRRLHLPDADDVHVLAAAVTAGADCIVTLNRADFPRHVLAAEGVARRDPDGLLWELWSGSPGAVAAVCDAVVARARQAGAEGADGDRRALLKRAHLPRLAKALAEAGDGSSGGGGGGGGAPGGAAQAKTGRRT